MKHKSYLILYYLILIVTIVSLGFTTVFMPYLLMDESTVNVINRFFDYMFTNGVLLTKTVKQ